MSAPRLFRSSADEAKSSLAAFLDRVDHETWRGAITAFRNGAKARLLGDMDGSTCNYTGRRDFGEAWVRGWGAADAALAAGETIDWPVDLAERRRTVAFLRMRGWHAAAGAIECGEHLGEPKS